MIRIIINLDDGYQLGGEPTKRILGRRVLAGSPQPIRSRRRKAGK